jgi:hypothetical protein
VSGEPSSSGPGSPGKPEFLLLERVTAGVLLLVLVAVGWMTWASYFPEWGRLFPVEVEVILVLGVLTAALVLVTVLSLLHTRR